MSRSRRPVACRDDAAGRGARGGRVHAHAGGGGRGRGPPDPGLRRAERHRGRARAGRTGRRDRPVPGAELVGPGSLRAGGGPPARRRGVRGRRPPAVHRRTRSGRVTDPSQAAVQAVQSALAISRLRTQLQPDQAQQAADAVLAQVRRGRGASINPRYGRFDLASFSVQPESPDWHRRSGERPGRDARTDRSPRPPSRRRRRADAVSRRPDRPAADQPRGSPPGLLSWPAWERLRAADAVLAADPDPDWPRPRPRPAAPSRTSPPSRSAGGPGGWSEQAAAGGRLVWLGSPDGDPGLTDALAEHLSRHAVADAPPRSRC